MKRAGDLYRQFDMCEYELDQYQVLASATGSPALERSVRAWVVQYIKGDFDSWEGWAAFMLQLQVNSGAGAVIALCEVLEQCLDEMHSEDHSVTMLESVFIRQELSRSKLGPSIDTTRR